MNCDTHITLKRWLRQPTVRIDVIMMFVALLIASTALAGCAHGGNSKLPHVVAASAIAAFEDRCGGVEYGNAGQCVGAPRDGDAVGNTVPVGDDAITAGGPSIQGCQGGIEGANGFCQLSPREIALERERNPFVAKRWERITDSNASQDPIFVITQLGKEHYVSDHSQWDWAPASVVVTSMNYLGDSDEYTVSARIYYLPIPFVTQALQACGSGSTGHAVDCVGAELLPSAETYPHRNAVAELVASQGQHEKFYLWKHGSSWIASSSPPPGPIATLGWTLLFIILIPIVLAFLFLVNEHSGSAGKGSGSAGAGPAIGL